jgi:hypothetical protein
MKFKAYYRGVENTDILDGAFFEAKDYDEATQLAKNVYDGKLVSVVSVKLLKCYHKHKDGGDCNYQWEYAGRRDKSATCPNCFKQVKIEDATVC